MIIEIIFTCFLDKNIPSTIHERYILVSKNNFSHNIRTLIHNDM
jgi:hypothetical protein